MNDLWIFLGNFVFIVFHVIAFFLYSFAIRSFADKEKGVGAVLIGLCLSTLLLLTALYSWLPGKIGYQLSMLDGALVFEEGAFIRNFGFLLGVQALDLGLGTASYLWACLRRKNRFEGKYLLYLLLFTAVFGVSGYFLSQSTFRLSFSDNRAAAFVVQAVLALLGAGFWIWLIASGISDRRSRKKKASVNQEDVLRYQIMQEKQSLLTQKGDYAALIPLLIEATSLQVSREQKIRIWKDLGTAYKEIGNDAKAEEYFQIASRL